jgi:hypothetical protein
MSTICVCGGRLGATGQGNCVIQFYTTHNYILMPTYKEDGTKNFIDISNPATVGATILTLTGASTPMLERLYPLPFAENVTREKTERVTETPPSGNVYNVQDGLRQNVMEFFGQNASFSFARELNEFGCTKMSYFSVDINGTLEGYVDDSDPTKFYPLPMMQNTFYQMYMYATDTSIQKLQLSFNLQRNFDETQIYYITANDLGYPATDLVGLIPASIAVSNITTTGATFTVTENGMNALSQKPIEGLLNADFDVINQTDGSTVVLTGLTEGNPGVYAATYVAIVGTHTFEVTANAPGYDGATTTYTDPA